MKDETGILIFKVLFVAVCVLGAFASGYDKGYNDTCSPMAKTFFLFREDIDSIRQHREHKYFNIYLNDGTVIPVEGVGEYVVFINGNTFKQQ